MRFWPLLFLTLTLMSLFQPQGRVDFENPNSRRIHCPFEKPILCAYFLGQKSEVSRSLLQIHREMNLLHLMTPSGLHLGSLLLLLSLISKVSKRSIKRTFFFLEDKRYCLFLLATFTYSLEGIDSFKRMILFALLRLLPFSKISQKTAFFLTFLICACAGQLSENPMSFSFSFLFLGVLLFSKNRLFLFLSLFFGQAFISEWMGNSFSPLTAVVGLILSGLSPFLFISFLPELVFPTLPISNTWISLLGSIHNFLRFPLPLIFLTSIPILFFLLKPKVLRVALPLSLFFTLGDLSPNLKGSSFPSPPPFGFSKMEQKENKFILTYGNKLKCHSKLLGDEWRTNCYK